MGQYCIDMSAIEWREVRPGIYASSEGQVAREAGGKDIGGAATRIGYRQVSIKAKTIGVHRLIAEAFIGPPPTSQHQVNHKNGVKSDNRAANLEWVTCSENARHAIDVLKRKAARGERAFGNKLAEGQVREIRVRLGSGESRGDIARHYGVNGSTIRAIELGITWKWLA